MIQYRFIYLFPVSLAVLLLASSCNTQHQTQSSVPQDQRDFAVAAAKQNDSVNVARNFIDGCKEKELGDFDGAEFRYAGITSRFFRRDGRFMVRTDGPDGRLADFEIKYAFGIWPLQQYLIEFPGGRTQALGIAWDARAKNEGGQRWVHLYPNEKIDYRDPLHWTGLYQNWNLECATCHSTNLKKGYDAASNTYKTTFSEINVACEACHGPGSRHGPASRAPCPWPVSSASLWSA